MINYKKDLNLHHLVWPNKNRSCFEIIVSMLEAARANNGTALSTYSLMKHAAINSVQLKKYLKSLTEVGLIEIDIKNGRVLYRASEKGLEFLRRYYVLARMMLSTRGIESWVKEESNFESLISLSSFSRK